MTTPGRVLAICPLVTITRAATIAPSVAIFTTLACIVHKPEYTSVETRNPLTLAGHPTSAIPLHLSNLETRYNLCASDPVVQAAVATLTLGESIYFMLVMSRCFCVSGGGPSPLYPCISLSVC